MSRIPPPGFPTARSLILAQHRELRGLLRTGAVLAGAASRGDRPCLYELPNLIESLKDKFVEHLSFEEATLVPLLKQADASDVTRAKRLATEHQKQRREFEILLTLARTSADPETVAFSFQGLLNALLTDMDEEERWLLQVGDAADSKAGCAEGR
jgi:iron-sulfur cluster repair protein YtfE (RIC family)